jgi:hypothetical protein
MPLAMCARHDGTALMSGRYKDVLRPDRQTMNEVTVAEVTKEAAQAHQSGRLVEAEALYRRALGLRPD